MSRLITKVLHASEVFVSQRSVGNVNAALSSKNPGVSTNVNSVFGSNPDIPGYVLAEARFRYLESTITL